jgi:hypothetical protein
LFFRYCDTSIPWIFNQDPFLNEKSIEKYQTFVLRSVFYYLENFVSPTHDWQWCVSIGWRCLYPTGHQWPSSILIQVPSSMHSLYILYIYCSQIHVFFFLTECKLLNICYCRKPKKISILENKFLTVPLHCFINLLKFSFVILDVEDI